MKPAPFNYCRPGHLDEVLAALFKYENEGRILAGGMSLGAMLNMRLARPKVIIDINHVAGIDKIQLINDHIVIGALVRQAVALVDASVVAHAPLLARALPNVGHYQTRNRGTVVGSVAHAEPSAEIPLALLVSRGYIELASCRGKRRIAANDFFISTLVTARRPNEFISAISLPIRKPRTGYAFNEFAIRHGDFAVVAAACQLSLSQHGKVNELVLGFSGIADRSILINADRYCGISCDVISPADVASDSVEQVSPREDLHATAAFRRQLVRVLTGRVVATALSEARDESKNHA